MVKKATSCLLVYLLMAGLFVSMPAAKAQTANPSQAVISVSGVPAGTTSLAVEVTLDSSIISISSASSDVSGALAIGGSNGVGIAVTSGELPSSFTITANLTGVAEGTSNFTLGNVLDMIGGTEIAGASATADTSSVTVGSSTTSSSTTSSSTSGGPGGNLDNDTVVITITGADISSTTAVNVTLAFSDSNVVQLATTSPTFSGTGATQLLTSADADQSIVSAVWDGTVTDGQIMITAMLTAGANAGTSTIGVAKVEVAGGTDVTSNVVASVSPSSVTNSATAVSDCGTFTLVSPTKTLIGPGSAAVGVSIEDAGSGLSATINGQPVELSTGGGVAIVTLPASGSVDLSLSATCGAGSATVDLGSLDVTAGSGTAPTIKRAQAKVSAKGTAASLKVKGKGFVTDSTTVEVVPTDRTATTTTVKSKLIKQTLDVANCIPSGSYVNVTTPAGTATKKATVMGACSNSLF